MYNCRVYYEDTDVGGVVYHANYLKFCERARSELFFKKGLSPHKESEFFVVKNMECDFIKPAHFGDKLSIDSKLLSKKSASLVMLQEIYLDGDVIFRATVKLAYLKDKKPSKIPIELFDIFNECK